MDLRGRIEESWAGTAVDGEAVAQVMAGLDDGSLRVAEKRGDGPEGWVVHEWIKLAILLYFRAMPMREGSWGDYHWHDKIPLKKELSRIRVVPPGTARYGSHLEPGCVLMPGY